RSWAFLSRSRCNRASTVSREAEGVRAHVEDVHFGSAKAHRGQTEQRGGGGGRVDGTNQSQLPTLFRPRLLRRSDRNVRAGHGTDLASGRGGDHTFHSGRCETGNPHLP